MEHTFLVFVCVHACKYEPAERVISGSKLPQALLTDEIQK